MYQEILLAILAFVIIHSLRQGKYLGLPSWPLLGMLPSLISALHGDVYEWLTDVIIRQNGTFFFKGPWLTDLSCFITSDPRNLEHILKSRFSNFPKGAYFRDVLNDFLGDGIFNADDDTWQRQRKTTSIEFHSSKFRGMTMDSVRHLVHARLLPVLEASANSSVFVDLQDVLLRLTFDNVCTIALGVDPGCLKADFPVIPFARAFEDATEAAILRFITPTFVWKTMRRLSLGFERKLAKSIQVVNSFAEEVIKARKIELLDKCAQKTDLLSVFMALDGKNGNSFSDKFLSDLCVNFILAGRDTSSMSLTWFFWLLHQHPRVEERIFCEIDTLLNEREHGDASTLLDFSPEEIKNMNYLQASLSEALRLYPSVPVDHKQAVEDDALADGVAIKKGSKIIYAIYAMGRMESIWGKDCRQYRPERWLREGKFMSESAYKFAVFNGGPRLCLGKDFAYYQMKFVAASIIYRYKIIVKNNHPVAPKLALTMYMKHGLQVRLVKRAQINYQNG